MTVNKTLWAATIISIAAYQFWAYLPKNSFYIGLALFILMLSHIIYTQNKNLFVSFFLLCISFSNFIDELFFDPKTNGINELIAALLIPTIYYARKNSQQRIIYFFNKNYLSRIFSRRHKNSNRDEKK